MKIKSLQNFFHFDRLAIATARADCVGGEDIPDIMGIYHQELQNYFSGKN